MKRFGLGLVVLILVGMAASGCVRIEKKKLWPRNYGLDGKATDRNLPIALSIEYPRMDEVVDSTDVAVRFSLSNYQLKKGADGHGNHVHVIVDNGPYMAIYDVSQPVLIEGLTPGTHTIRAFASRPWHESHKNAEAFAYVTFHVEKKDFANSPDWTQPVLTYSRPKGTYEGENADAVLVDFWVQNVELGDDYQVRCIVGGKAYYWDVWKPYYIGEFPEGEKDTEIILDLVDKDGVPVNNVFNHTKRTIKTIR